MWGSDRNPTDEGKLQLAAVLDLHSRPLCRVLHGYPPRRGTGPRGGVHGGAVGGVLFQTDRGSEDTANLFIAACRSAGVTQSMGRTGSALDINRSRYAALSCGDVLLTHSTIHRFIKRDQFGGLLPVDKSGRF